MKWQKMVFNLTNILALHLQCSPSRANILTGLYPHNNEMMGLAHMGFCIGEKHWMFVINIMFPMIKKDSMI